MLRVSQYTGVTERRTESGEGIDSRSDSLIGYKRVLKGQLAVNIMLAWNGSLGVSPYDGIVSPAYCVYSFKPALEPWFFHYLLRTPQLKARIKANSRGIVDSRLRLYSDDLYRIESGVPPVEEQTAIVKYLAHANARIDLAIAAKRRLVALLNELAVSIQNSIVTAVSDGGKIISIGQSSTLVQTGPFGSQLHADEYVENGIPVINPAHISALGLGFAPDPSIGVSAAKAETLRRHRFETGDIVLARRGDLGRSAVVLEEQAGWLCGTGSLIVRLHLDRWNPEYFQMMFSSRENKERLQFLSVGSTMANLNGSQVARMRMQLPTLERQEAAVREVRCAQDDHAKRLAMVTREIILLHEFRTRLIADVVTGQVDVRAIAATLPDAPETSDNQMSGPDDDLEEALNESEK